MLELVTAVFDSSRGSPRWTILATFVDANDRNPQFLSIGYERSLWGELTVNAQFPRWPSFRGDVRSLPSASRNVRLHGRIAMPG